MKGALQSGIAKYLSHQVSAWHKLSILTQSIRATATLPPSKRLSMLSLIWCVLLAISLPANSASLNPFKKKKKAADQPIIEIYENKWDTPRKAYKILGLLTQLTRFEGRERLTAPQLEKQMTSIVRTLMSGFKGPTPDNVSVAISAELTGSAKVTSDHTIVVPIGHLVALTTEDELAFVLAHELAHILKRDFQLDENIAGTKKVVARMASASVLGATIASVRIEKTKTATDTSFEVTQVDTDMINKTANDAVRTYFWISEFAESVVGPKIERGDEREADQFAIDLLARSGFNYGLGANAITRVDKEQSSLLKRVRDIIKERLQKRVLGSIPSFFSQKDQSVSFNQEAYRKEIERTGNEALKQLGVEILKYLRRVSSKTMKARRADLQVYIDKYYSFDQHEAAPARPSKDWQPYADLSLALYNRVSKAKSVRDHLSEGNIELAVTTGDGITSGITRNDSYFRFTKYMLRQAQYQSTGKQDLLNKAVQNLELGVRSNKAPPSMYAALASEYAAQGDLKKGLGVLDNADDVFIKEAFWPLRIGLLFRHGEQTQACALKARCDASEVGALKKQCKAELKRANQFSLLDSRQNITPQPATSTSNPMESVLNIFKRKDDLCASIAKVT